MSTVATDLLDAADKHVPTLGLNARRKFFHGLAVVMFVPGIAVDVSVDFFYPSNFHFHLLVQFSFSSPSCTVAGVHASIVQCCVCNVHIRGIYPIFRHIPFRSFIPSVYE
jgi:hypothetical protein